MKLVILQNFIKKRHLFKPALNKLLHIHRPYQNHCNPEHLPLVLLMSNFQSHPFKRSLSTLALQITSFQTIRTFLHTKNTITSFRSAQKKYLEHIDMEMLFCAWLMSMVLRLFGLLKRLVGLYS